MAKNIARRVDIRSSEESMNKVWTFEIFMLCSLFVAIFFSNFTFVSFVLNFIL